MALHPLCYCYTVHDQYGCESGCCGHRSYLCDENGNVLDEKWVFYHPTDDNYLEWAKELLVSYWPNIRIDLERCKVSEE